MSTSDPGILTAGLSPDAKPDAQPGLAELSWSGVVPAGLLDPAALTRLANEFFTSSPGTSQPTASNLLGVDPSGLNLLSQPVIASAPNEISLPSAPHFPSAPAGASPAAVAPVSASVQAGPPVVAGALAGSVPARGASASGFSFIDDVRPIFGGVKQKPENAYPEARPIMEFVRQPSQPSATLPGFGNERAISPEIFSPPTPTVPGSFGLVTRQPFPHSRFSKRRGPSFQARPLYLAQRQRLRIRCGRLLPLHGRVRDLHMILRCRSPYLHLDF